MTQRRRLNCERDIPTVYLPVSGVFYSRAPTAERGLQHPPRATVGHAVWASQAPREGELPRRPLWGPGLSTFSSRAERMKSAWGILDPSRPANRPPPSPTLLIAAFGACVCPGCRSARAPGTSRAGLYSTAPASPHARPSCPSHHLAGASPLPTSCPSRSSQPSETPLHPHHSSRPQDKLGLAACAPCLPPSAIELRVCVRPDPPFSHAPCPTAQCSARTHGSRSAFPRVPWAQLPPED